MDVRTATTASSYDQAAAQYLYGYLEVYATANKDETFWVEVVDNRDGTRTFERTMTEKEIGDEFTNQAQPLNWYPIRDEGEWGEEAEAAIAHAVTGAIPGNCTLMQHAMSGEVFALEYEGAESDTIIGVCGPLARNERDAALEDYDYNSEDAQWANGQPWNLYNRAAYEAE